MVIKNVSDSILHRRYFNRQGRELRPGEHTNVSGGASVVDIIKDHTFLKDIGALKVANKAEIVGENADIPLKTLDVGTGTKMIYGKVSGSYAGLHLPASGIITTANPERKIIVFVDRAEEALLQDAIGLAPVPTDYSTTTGLLSLYASDSTNAVYNGALGDITFAYVGKDAVAYSGKRDLTVGMPDSSGGLTVELTLPAGYTMSACTSTGGVTATCTDADTISLVFAKTAATAVAGVVQLTVNGNLVEVPFLSGATAIAVTAGLGAGAESAVAYKGDVAVTNAGETANITSTVDIDSIVVDADITATVGVTGLTAALVVPANAYAGTKSYEVALLDAQGATIFKFDIVEAAMAQPTFTINVNGGGAAGIVGNANTAITAAQNSVVYVSTVAMVSATAVFGATTVAGVLSNSDKTATFTIPANTDEVVSPVYSVSLLDADGARYLAVTLTQAVAAPAIQAKHAIGGTYVRVAPGGVFASVPAGGEVVYVQTITDIETATAGAVVGVVDGGKKFVAFTIPASATNPGYRVSINNAAGETIHTLVLGQGTYVAGVASVGDIEVMSAQAVEAPAVVETVEAPAVEAAPEAVVEAAPEVAVEVAPEVAPEVPVVVEEPKKRGKK